MITKKLIQKSKQIGAGLQSIWMGRKQIELLKDQTFSEAACSFPDRNGLHAYMHHHFQHVCPLEVKEHRKYFKAKNRGYGEDAFHSMWYCLIREYRPNNCLEIGIYRGQVISLWALLSRHFNFDCKIHGISPFTPAGDEVSTYLSNVDYKTDTIENHQNFSLPIPNLVKAFSTDSAAKTLICSEAWDLIYIDGSHDYDVALADYEICKDNLSAGGILVIDDSSLYSNFNPPLFSFAGHPGPSRIVQERALHELKYIGAVGHNNIFIK